MTVKAGARTGLARPDVFSFVSPVGETGDAYTPRRVSALDLARVRRSLNGNAAVGDFADFNRDGRIDVLDLAAARGNTLHALSQFSVLSAINAQVRDELGAGTPAGVWASL